MVSNWAWIKATLTSGGRSASEWWMKRSRSVSSSATCCGGGGTKPALPGRVPPIQSCERRSSPGCLPAPRAPSSSSRWAFARQSKADRQALRVTQLSLHPAECAQVVGDLFDIVGVADLEARFLVEQFGQRGLGALELRGEQRLLAYRAVEQPFDRRDQARHPGQARQRQFGLPVQVDIAGRRQRRIGRGQRSRHEGANRLTRRGRGGVGACGSGHCRRALISRIKLKHALPCGASIKAGIHTTRCRPRPAIPSRGSRAGACPISAARPGGRRRRSR